MLRLVSLALLATLACAACGGTAATPLFAPVPPNPDTGFRGEGIPPIRVDLGTTFRTIQLQDVEIGRNEVGPLPARAIGERVTVVSGDLRMSGKIVGPFYAGFEIAAGGGGSRAAVLQESPRVATTGGPSFHASTGPIVGLEGGHRQTVQVRAELMAGARIMTFDVEHDPTTAGPYNLLGWSPILEPRLKLERWIHPNFTVGAWVGADVLHPRDWASGVEIALHFQPFGGR